MDLKSLYVALQSKRYYLKVTSKSDKFSERKFYKLDKTKYYISEGANFLLMRYLAVTKFSGSFELSTMYINGDMCRNIYVNPTFVQQLFIFVQNRFAQVLKMG